MSIPHIEEPKLPMFTPGPVQKYVKILGVFKEHRSKIKNREKLFTLANILNQYSSPAPG